MRLCAKFLALCGGAMTWFILACVVIGAVKAALIVWWSL